MSGAPVTLRTRKFIRNKLLSRRQMVVDIVHPGRANVAKAEVQEMLAKKFKAETVICFGMATKFGGGKTTGFCCIYDNLGEWRDEECRVL